VLLNFKAFVSIRFADKVMQTLGAKLAVNVCTYLPKIRVQAHMHVCTYVHRCLDRMFAQARQLKKSSIVSFLTEFSLQLTCGE
jgi:hypothetical protein